MHPPPSSLLLSTAAALWGAAFENSVNQTLQMSQVDALVDRSRAVDGTPTSLLDLGYNRIVRPPPHPTPPISGRRQQRSPRENKHRESMYIRST